MKVGLDMKSMKRPPLAPLAAGLLVLAALWMAWTGWSAFSSNRLNTATATAKHAVAEKIRPLLKGFMDNANKLKDHAGLAAALQSGDSDAARAIVTQIVAGTDAVEFYTSDFSAGYADPEKFGFGNSACWNPRCRKEKPGLPSSRTAASAVSPERCPCSTTGA